MVSLYGTVVAVVGVVVVLVRIIVLASLREGRTRSGRSRAPGCYKSGPLIGRRAQSAEGYYRHHVVGSQFAVVRCFRVFGPVGAVSVSERLFGSLPVNVLGLFFGNS